MQPFTRLDGKAAPLPLANIDTDQIIPKQFLKTVEREGLAKGLFYDLRFDEQGREKPDFTLNRPEYRGAAVLVAGDNFGCGSSREHAPWALMDFGVRMTTWSSPLTAAASSPAKGEAGHGASSIRKMFMPCVAAGSATEVVQ